MLAPPRQDGRTPRRSSGSASLTSDKFAHVLARDVDGDAPGYPEASRAERPAGVTVLYGYAARLVNSGPKNPLTVDQVAEIAERYFAAFESLLSAGAVEGASDRANNHDGFLHRSCRERRKKREKEVRVGC